MVEISRIDTHFDDWDGLLSLIMSAFAYMDGVIDPPSSAHRLTAISLKEKATQEIGYVATEDGRLLGCVFCRPEPESLYIGKLAVSPDAQGKGIGFRLLQTTEQEADALRLPLLRLETRIELIGNHQRFAAWGFARTAEKSHPGYDRVTFIEMQKPLSR
ncbi:GNAT family N-acetyltransferase [Rhizobium sp. SL86]|uniref:GNAT family N-acetyltransferase n=1 Tax=Rhizobium sp. SL86 TaxID=2995148 RepID=UPI0022745777|nr:GNAT family N-acetyltransferase [Rhizobium sp. SL86]MCY1665203.1 GNAT family N-acetyltransferase [Rhizobium sp. SL86]